MTNSDSSSEDENFQDTVVSPTKSVRFQSQQELLEFYKPFSSSPAQNTRSSHKELFQSRLTSSSKMTDKSSLTKIKTQISDDPKPLRLPIMDNPLETYFNPELSMDEVDDPIEEPFELTPTSTAQEKQVIRDIHRANRLKKDRSNIYSSITKMTKSIIRVMNGEDERGWRELEARAIKASETLWEITDELHKARVEISEEEDEKFNRYSALLDSHLAKIKAHIRSQVTGIPILMAATEKAFKPERESHSDAYADEINEGDEEEIDQTMAMKAMMKQIINLSKKTVTTPPTKKEADYRSLKPVEIQPFSGDPTKFHYFREAFNADHEWRNLPKTRLALQLQSYLRGPALKLAQDHLKDKIDDTSYNTIWKALEDRYGGDFNEDASIAEQFAKLPVLRNLSCKELERTFDAFRIQYNYFEKTDPMALNNIKSILMRQAKTKLSVDLGLKYVIWCAEKRLPENFLSMREWLRIMYQASQKSDREYSHSTEEKPDRHRGRINLTREENFNESDDEEPQKDEENDSEEDDFTITYDHREKSYWVNPNNGGKRYPWNGKPSFPRKDQGFDPTKRIYSKTGPPKEPLKLKPTDTCVLCNVRHEMSDCPRFKALPLKEKKLIVRSSVLCFHCLSTKHFLKDCKTNKDRLCNVRNCRLYHHPLLHADTVRINVEYSIIDMEPLTEEETDSISHLFSETETINHIAHKGSVSLQTVVCNVTSGNNYIKTVALLDTGSTMTAIDEDFAMNNNLNIIGKRDGQEVYVIDRLVKMKGHQYKVELTVSSVDKDTSTRIEAWTIKNLVQNCGIVDWSERKRDFPHLQKINFPKLPENPKITILFGCNVTRMFKSTKTVADENNLGGPIAIRTFLGWTCVGNSANTTQIQPQN